MKLKKFSILFVFCLFAILPFERLQADDCEEFFSLTASRNPVGENQFELFIGYMNAALIIMKSGEVVFSTTTYLSMDSHRELVKVTKKLYGPIGKIIFLGEIYKSEIGVEKIIDTSGFGETLPPRMIDNSSDHLATLLRTQTAYLTEDAQILSFKDEPGFRHLDPTLDT